MKEAPLQMHDAAMFVRSRWARAIPNFLAMVALSAAAACAQTGAVPKTQPATGVPPTPATPGTPATPASAGTQPSGVVSSLPNLILNGNFEQPNATNDGPAHWQEVDNLVWHWTTDPDALYHGKVIKIDTGIDEHFAYKWWIDHFVKGVPLNKAPSKPAGDAGYGSIGGNDGGYYWSDYIPVKPGRGYRVYVDAKGPGSMVFVRGYEKAVPLTFGLDEPATLEQLSIARGEPQVDDQHRPIRHRLHYSFQQWFSAGGSSQWATYSTERSINPNNNDITKNVRFIRIMLYPTWPNATYWYDNVRVYEVDPDAKQPPRGTPTEADYLQGKVVRPTVGAGSVPEKPPATQPAR